MAQSFINDRATDYQSLKNRLMGGAPGGQHSSQTQSAMWRPVL